MNDEFSIYLSGEKLYGDDFSIEQIHQWYQDEAEGYTKLWLNDKNQYRYSYHQLNTQNAFKHLNNKHFNEVLGVGSAFGDEFQPIIQNIGHITILDPSYSSSTITDVLGIQTTYKKPEPSGDMPFGNNIFDLITCLGVLHHIPNVSYVMKECFRCLKIEGIMLLREPIVSMGDWRRDRKGLTKRERGIPVKILDGIVRKVGFKILKRTFCVFPLIPKITNNLGISAYNNVGITKIDAILSCLFSWNIRYHRNKNYEKFAPSSIFYILKK